MKTKLSKIIAGTMNWGLWYKKFTVSEMEQFMRICIENNITSFDHADIYGNYTTEAEFGKALNQSNIKREDIQLISKCGIQHTNGRNNKIKHYDYSKEYIIWSVENSLKNLQTDYLDVLLLHRPSPLMIFDEIADAIEILKKVGKIIDFGVSNFTPSQTSLISQKTKVSYNQIQFSVTHLDQMTDGSLDFMQQNSIVPMAWNPLGSVFKEDTEQTIRLKKLLTFLSDKYNTSTQSILLAWIHKHPGHIIPVVGTTNIERIKEINQSLEINLELEDWFALWTESRGNNVP